MPSAKLKRDMTKLLGERDNSEEEGKYIVDKDRCFLVPGVVYKDMKGYTIRLAVASYVEEGIRDLIHVPALRGNPERTYRATTYGPKFPGLFDNYVASIIYHWKQRRTKELLQLGKALETLGLTWKIEPKQVEETRVEIRVARLRRGTHGGARDLVSIADVGFGIRRCRLQRPRRVGRAHIQVKPSWHLCSAPRKHKQRRWLATKQKSGMAV